MPTLEERVAAKSELMKQGKMVEATREFFAADAKTDDHTEVKTEGRQGMVEKMEGFLGSIAKVNEITLHHTAVAGDVSFTEWTFDFDMKDGSKTYWHEIIRSVWKDGQVVHEQYFLA